MWLKLLFAPPPPPPPAGSLSLFSRSVRPSRSQVDCLFRLLERATRHGDTTKRPGPRPPPFDAAVPPDDRTVMGGLSPNSTANTNTKVLEKEVRNRRVNCAATHCPQRPIPNLSL